MTDTTLLIQAEELKVILYEPTLILLDCRYSLADTSKGRKDFMQGHIPGAYFMDIGHDLSSPVIPGITGRHPLPHPEILSSTLRATGMNPDCQVVVYDQSNSAYAGRAWWLLYWLGHENVRVLDGGMNAWMKQGLPVDNQWPVPKQGHFQPRVKHYLTLQVHEVATHHGIVVDSREYKRYTGETEPIDPVAGHIPGAVCMPYLDNTDEAGFWKPAAALREKFASFTGPPGPPPVFYCGSGVTACHNILAYKIATGQDARLYPGSWSEWIHYYEAATGPS